MRIYVLVTGVDPLKIYVYQEGLIRFASEKYSNTFENRYAHLTNYSLNKKNDWAPEPDEDNDLKWTLTHLSKKMKEIGIDTGPIWSKIYDIIIKSFLSIDNHILAGIDKAGNWNHNAFELLGYDIIIDNNLDP